MIRKIIPTILLSLSMISCKKEQKQNIVAQPTKIIPVDISSKDVPDFNYPENPEVINSWMNSQNDQQIARHAWGIWDAITKKSDQSYEGQDLLVFETWMGVKELSDSVASGNKDAGCTPSFSKRNTLQKPKQFAHAGLLGASNNNDEYEILETVSYSPTAACFATQNLIFNKSTLDKLLKKGEISKIPDFPVPAVTVKPTWYVTKSSTGIVKFPAWDQTPVPAKQYGNKTWEQHIFVDLDNKQLPAKKLVPVVGDNPTPAQIADATCNLTDFIYFKLDSEAAKYLNEHQDQGTPPERQFSAGDVALLAAMHVSTKEIPNWTWQTFFWVPNADKPGTPSSELFAKVKPKTLSPAASHYAVSPCYSMVYPNQPITGGTDKDATPIICYNPFLEAGFGPKVFSFSNKFHPEFQYGVQTNCSSCHALATSSGNLGYSTNQYVDMLDPRFKDDVQVDFAWSIQGNINQTK